MPILSYKSPDQSTWPISHLIFDLDNTLYPASSRLADEMHRRMTSFVAQYLKISLSQAEIIRKAGFTRHGTTMRWLQVEQGMQNPAEFLEYVHPVNLDEFLVPAPELRPFIESIPLPKVILTNAPHNHAQRILKFYGIEDCFGEIFDLEANNYVGKPNRSVYEKCLSVMACPAQEAIFIDDIPAYLETFDMIGGHCILVDEKSQNEIIKWHSIPTILDLIRHLT